MGPLLNSELRGHIALDTTNTILRDFVSVVASSRNGTVGQFLVACGLQADDYKQSKGCVLLSAVNMGGSSVSSPPSGVVAFAMGISDSGEDIAKGGEM